MAKTPKARRPRGAGSVSRRKDGLYVGRLPRDPETGQRPAVYGHSEAEVALKLAQRLLDRQARLAPPDRQLLRDYLPRWLEEVKRPRLAASSYAAYDDMIRAHLTPGLGHLTLARLTPAAIQRFYAAKHQAGYAPASIRLMHSILRAALQTAVKWSLVPRNVATLVDVPALPKRDVAVLDEGPAKRLLAAARGDPREALYVVALTTGLRRGELVGLRWADVDFEAGRLHVRQKHYRVRRRLIENAPKGGRQRTVPLPRLAAEALRRHQVRQATVRLGMLWARPDLVFTGHDGRPMDAGSFSSAWLPALLKRAGLPRMTGHQLRHSFASVLLKQREDVAVVSELLGHASPEITYRVYRHVLRGEATAAIERLDALLREES